MKLYVWREVETLRDWSAGVAFAVAESRKEAVDALIAGGDASCTGWPGDVAAWQYEDFVDRLRAELLAVEPAVADFPCGGWVHGGS